MNIFRSLRSMSYRRGPSRILAGICSGLADQFGWNLFAVRIVMLLSFLLPVIGWVAYLVAWLILPWQDDSIPLERALGGSR